MHGQVGVLHRSDAHYLGHPVQLLFVELRVGFTKGTEAKKIAQPQREGEVQDSVGDTAVPIVPFLEGKKSTSFLPRFSFGCPFPFLFLVANQFTSD